MQNEDVSFDNMSMEQQFAQVKFEQLVKNMSLQQAQETLIYMHKINTIKENSYQSMLKKSWFGDLIHE
jgi:Phycobilisome degradation protein nblA